MPCYTKGRKAPLKRDRFDLGDGEYVVVRELDAPDLIALQAKNKAGADPFDIDAAMLALCVVDDDGLPIFEDADDVKANFHVGVSAWRDIIGKALEVSGVKPGKN